jgi:tetratricopeptide (TPR) repeat protein
MTISSKIGLMTILIFIFTSLANLTADVSRTVSNYALINKAILLKLPPTNNDLPEEVLQLQKKMTTEIAKAAYGNALEIVMMSLDKYPKNFLLQTYLAMIIGDYASQHEGPLKQQMIEISKSVFDKLMPEVDTQPLGIIFYFKNEYYFRFAQYKQQYENGVARVNAYWGTKEWLAKGFGYYPQGMGGYYSQGVGASNYAYELYQKGDKKLAQLYAQKALVAWAQCFSYENTYYNAYVHYALSLGLLGNKEEMLRALQRSADLIHQDLSYPEFKKVIELIDKVSEHNHSP